MRLAVNGTWEVPAKTRGKDDSFAVLSLLAMTNLQPTMWFCLAAYSLHVLEEFVFDWQNWARNVLNLPAQWSDFYITNAVVIVLGVVAAEVAPTWPAVALGFPALMLINATFFHVAPSPGRVEGSRQASLRRFSFFSPRNRKHAGSARRRGSTYDGVRRRDVAYGDAYRFSQTEREALLRSDTLIAAGAISPAWTSIQ